MKPVAINGDIWRAVRVPPSDPSLIDRTGKLKLATTDPDLKMIFLSRSITSPLLDRVLIHEVTHAVTISYGLLLSEPINIMLTEEWNASIMEEYGLEILSITSEILGRPVCVRKTCFP